MSVLFAAVDLVFSEWMFSMLSPGVCPSSAREGPSCAGVNQLLN